MRKQHQDRRQQRGYAFLIEMLIIMFILVLLAATALPNAAKIAMDAQAQHALLSVETLSIANRNYSLLYPATGFAPSIANLTGGSAANQSANGAYLVLPSMAPSNIVQDGYNFTYSRPNATTFSYVATPILSTNHRSFYAGSDGVVRFSDSGTATSASPAVNQLRVPMGATSLMVGPSGPPGAAGAPGASASSVINAPQTISGNINGPFSNGASYWVIGASGRTVDIQAPASGDDGKVITIMGSPPATGYQNGTHAPIYNLTCTSCSTFGANSGQFFPADRLGWNNNTSTSAPSQQFVAIQGIWVPLSIANN